MPKKAFRPEQIVPKLRQIEVLIVREKHVKPMDITGKPMKGWAMVAPEGVVLDADLIRHVECAIAFVSTLPKK